MKYSVLGFNQAKVIAESDLDLTDLMLLQYIVSANGSSKMKHILKDDITYAWLSHEKIMEDLPILRLSESTIRNRLLNLKKTGWIDSEKRFEDGVRGSRTYYTVTIKTISYLYDEKDIMSLKNDMIGVSCHSKMTSDNILTIDNLLDKSNTKVLLENPPTEDNDSISDSIESKSYDTEKPKKKNLFDKCEDATIQYTDNTELQSKLREYLSLRLEIARNEGKGFYVNMWKGLLGDLNKLTQDDNTAIQIVEQSIKKGWKGFYALKDYNNNHGNRNSGMQVQMPDAKSFTDRDERDKYESKLVEDAIKNGRRAYY